MNRNLVSWISRSTVLTLTEGAIFFDHMNFVIHITFKIAYLNMLYVYLLIRSMSVLPFCLLPEFINKANTNLNRQGIHVATSSM